MALAVCQTVFYLSIYCASYGITPHPLSQYRPILSGMFRINSLSLDLSLPCAVVGSLHHVSDTDQFYISNRV